LSPPPSIISKPNSLGALKATLCPSSRLASDCVRLMVFLCFCVELAGG